MDWAQETRPTPLKRNRIQPCVLQATNHFSYLSKPLVLGVVLAIRPAAVVTVRGHCRNEGTNLLPLLVLSPAIQGFAVLRLWRAKCVSSAAVHRWLNWFGRKILAEFRGISRVKQKRVNMYSTKTVKGVPAELAAIDPHEVGQPESSPYVGGGFMSTRGTRRVKNNGPETVPTSSRPNSHERLSSSVTALVIEQVLAGLGVHARLSDIARGAQLIESAIIQSRLSRKPEHPC